MPLSTIVKEKIVAARKAAGIFVPNSIADYVIEAMKDWEMTAVVPIKPVDVLGYKDANRVTLAGIDHRTDRMVVLTDSQYPATESDVKAFAPIHLQHTREYAKILNRQQLLDLLDKAVVKKLIEAEDREQIIHILDEEYEGDPYKLISETLNAYEAVHKAGMKDMVLLRKAEDFGLGIVSMGKTGSLKSREAVKMLRKKERYEAEVSKIKESGFNGNDARATVELAKLLIRATISNAEIEFFHGLGATFSDKILRRDGVKLPREPVLLEKQMALSAGTSINMHIAVLEALGLERNSAIIIPEGSFDLLFAIPSVVGCETLPISTGHTNFKLTADSLSSTIEGANREGIKISCLVLTNPTNPFGLVYSKEELIELAKVAIKHDVRLICDEHFAGLSHRGAPEHVSYYSIGSIEVEGKGLVDLAHEVISIRGANKITGNELVKLGVCYTKDEGLIAKTKARLRVNDDLPTYGECLGFDYVIKEASKRFGLNCAVLAKKREVLKETMAAANKDIGSETFSLATEPEAGVFACIKMPASKLRELGVKSNLDLAIYIDKTVGVSVRSVAGMLIRPADNENFYFRVNFSVPTTGEMQEAFTRLATLVKAINQNQAPNYNSINTYLQRQLNKILDSVAVSAA